MVKILRQNIFHFQKVISFLCDVFYPEILTSFQNVFHVTLTLNVYVICLCFLIGVSYLCFQICADYYYYYQVLFLCFAVYVLVPIPSQNQKRNEVTSLMETVFQGEISLVISDVETSQEIFQVMASFQEIFCGGNVQRDFSLVESVQVILVYYYLQVLKICKI